MALLYNVYERDNKIPNAKMPRMAVAYSRQIRQVSTKELAEDISDRCTVHRADVRAVLDALSLSASQYLLNGFGVQLGELGSLSMSIRCKAAPSIAEFKPELITGAKVRYTPSTEMIAKVRSVGFVSATQLAVPGANAPAAPRSTDPDGDSSNPVGDDTTIGEDV